MFPVARHNDSTKKKLQSSFGNSSLSLNTIASVSKERQKATAINQHFMSRGFGDDALGMSSHQGYPSFAVTAKKKYGKYFTEEDLRVGNTCMLCGSNIIEEWGRHTSYSMHRFSMSIFLTIFENWRFRSAKEIIDVWMDAALIRGNHNTIIPLVSTDISILKRRLWSLLLFLQKHGVLKESLNFAKGRSFLFDQAEWIGDVSIPPLLFDAFGRVFDFEAKDSMWRIIFDEIGVLFGNPHLEATFNFLELHRIIADGEKVIQGKTKSDFVEALAGELKLFLIGGELDFSTSKQACQVVENQYSLYQITNHCLHVLVVLILMAFLGPAVNRVVEVISRINKIEGLPLREIPKSSHVACTIPNITPSKRLVQKQSSTLLTSMFFDKMKILPQKRCPQAVKHIQNITLQNHAPYVFSIDESPPVLPIIFEDSKLYDTEYWNDT